MIHYFIYPKGFNGKILADIICFFEPNSTISYVDDSMTSSSLEQLAQQIKNTPASKLLIASNKHKEALEQKCKALGIHNFHDGVKLFGTKNQHYLMKHLKTPKKAVGIYLGGFAQEKHLGELDIELKRLGVEVFYITKNKQVLELNRNRIGGSVAIIAWHDFLAEVRNIGAFVSTNFGKTDKSVLHISLGHSLMHFPQLHYHYRDEITYKSILNHYLQNSDYFVISNQVDLEMFKKLEKKYNPRTKIIENGYLGFDSFKKTTYRVKNPNKVVVSPKDHSVDRERVLTLLGELVEEERLHIVLRFDPTERVLEIEEEAKKRFGNRPNFSVDTSPKFEETLKSECLSVITSYSTLAYSFPLSVSLPAVIYGIADIESSEGFKFVNPKLHKHAMSPREVRKILLEIMENTERYRQEIEAYKDRILFPTKNSSHTLAKKICKILQEAQTKCQICGAESIIALDGYKHSWEFCTTCRCGRSIKKERCALESFAPLLRKFLRKKRWTQSEKRLLRDEDIALDSQKEFDYFLSQNHIEFSKKRAEYFYEMVFRKHDLELQDKDILEISGGGGDFICYFLNKGANSVYLSEFNKSAVEYAKTKLGIPAFSYDINSEALDEALVRLGKDAEEKQFDYIIMRGTMSWCFDVKQFFNELSKHLKSGGVLIIDDIQLATLGLIMHLQFSEYAYLRHYSPEFLESKLKEVGFAVTHKYQKPSDSMVHAWYDRYPLERYIWLYYEQKAVRKLQFEASEFRRLEFNARDIRDWIMIAKKTN
ncbi:MAG: class I SAM-dependent methyltransferase [Wolinella sp.]